MKKNPTPLRLAGAGSPPTADDELPYDAWADGVVTLGMPGMVAGVEIGALAIARDTLASFLGEVERWNPRTHPHGPRLPLDDVPSRALDIVNRLLSEGEVSIEVAGERSLVIRESVFTGFWRVREFAADARPTGDWLEAGVLPRLVLEAARAFAAPTLPPVGVPPGAMNSPALLQQITAQVRARRPGAPTHVINLTLYPMTADDHALIDDALAAGPVAIVSRSFGNCRITSTGVRDVWRVRYFNAMNTLILNTIEVVDMPEVARAAVEDLEASRGRLAELIDWIDESCTEAVTG